jgi:hypothetical protein
MAGRFSRSRFGAKERFDEGTKEPRDMMVSLLYGEVV